MPRLRRAARCAQLVQQARLGRTRRVQAAASRSQLQILTLNHNQLDGE